EADVDARTSKSFPPSITHRSMTSSASYMTSFSFLTQSSMPGSPLRLFCSACWRKHLIVSSVSCNALIFFFTPSTLHISPSTKVATSSTYLETKVSRIIAISPGRTGKRPRHSREEDSMPQVVVPR
ncbi:unnamed protein product, partial [Musa acuminata subsp. burmannicoides]